MKLKRKSHKLYLLFFGLLIFGCKKDIDYEKATSIKSDIYVEQNKTNVEYYSNGKIKSKIRYIIHDGSAYTSEALFFLPTGKIDSTRSVYCKIIGEDLKYFSPFDSIYKVPKNRFIIFKSSDSIKKDFSNINNLELKEIYFDSTNTISEYAKNISKRGIIEELVFAESDSLINGKKSVRLIQTRIFVDTDDLLN